MCIRDRLAGAVYGVYSDEACQNLITEMPPTDANGVSSVTIDKTQDVVYLKEITGPSGYLVDATAHGVSLVMGSKVTQELFDDEKKASLTVYKEGEVLTGADVTDEKVTFRYETRRQKGAVYNVYAGAVSYTHLMKSEWFYSSLQVVAIFLIIWQS